MDGHAPDYYDGWYHRAPEIHKSIGILLMMALIVRIIWRRIAPPPVALTSYSQRALAPLGHTPPCISCSLR